MQKIIALVPGDGSAPEMMAVACKIAIEAAKKDGIKIIFEETPMGWCALDEHGDTLPKKSFDRAKELEIIFFGGVGDPKLDNTIGKERPALKPEGRCLLALRKEMGLLVNLRPMIYMKALAGLAGVRPERIPEQGIKQFWHRYLLEDGYFGNEDLMSYLSPSSQEELGLKLKRDVTGHEHRLANIAYFTKARLEKFFRIAFALAQAEDLPLISLDKANVMPQYEFWRKVVTRIGADEFPKVPLFHQLADSAAALLFTPEKLHGVIVAGNEQGDLLSDGAAAALGSMGMMCSSAVNPDTGAAMFESGAGTAPTLKGQDVVNPVGRILTAAMMLKHIGAVKGAKAIQDSVEKVLLAGFRTLDMMATDSLHERAVGTKEMGDKVLEFL